MAFTKPRFFAVIGAAAVGLAALTGGATLAIGQTADEIDDFASEEIRVIDPTTGGPSLVIDPSLPQPYGTELDDEDAGIPPLPVIPGTQATVAEPLRGPASRSISEPLVQATPPAPPASSDDPFVVRSILPIEGTIRYGEWYWDESRAPANGPIVITVDLDARVISVFRDGHEIGTAVALLGTREHPTPLGVFPILTKERDNVSEIYNNAPMPWTLRLTWDGIAIHGSPVANGYASHGCIGVPDPFAERLFEVARRGDRVVITRGQYINVGDRLLNS